MDNQGPKIIPFHNFWEVPDHTPEQILIQSQSADAIFLGSGTYGEVWKVGNYAVKIITLGGDKKIQDYEIEALRSIDCPFSVKYYGAFRTNWSTYIVMELMKQDTLKAFFHAEEENETSGIPEPAISQLTCQILLLLNYIKKTGKAHRDIKPQNMFPTKDGIIKVGDYGFCKTLENGQSKTNSECGTPIYMGPEIGNGSYNAFCVDIWSLGLVVAELFFGQYPLDDTKSGNIYAREYYLKSIQENLIACFEKSKNVLSLDLIDFVLKCCKYEPELRLTTEQLLKHKFITKHNDMDKIQPLIDCEDWSKVQIPAFEEVFALFDGYF